MIASCVNMTSAELTRDDFDAGPCSIDQIEPGLWIGNLTAASDKSLLSKHRINCILTVDSCPLPRNITFLPHMTTKFIPDLPYEDLLSHFDETYNFINTGQENGNVLVHCYFGVSRSATVVMAFLMKKYLIGFDEALQRLRQHRNICGPNIGFQAQLRLYHTLNFQIDKNNIQFKRFRLRVAANKVAKVKILPQDCADVIKPDPSLICAEPNPRVYRCKLCRRIVASANNLLPHVKGEKPSWKDSKWSTEDYTSFDLCREMYFIEPLSWIQSVTHSESGKILCSRCNSKLGSFSWINGSRCGCGAKVSPSFYLVPSKVDYSNLVKNVQVTV